MAWSYEGMSLAEAWRSADDVAEDDERFMRAALEQAKRAALEGEVPIGAVVVCQGEVIAEARNHREADADPSAHAEFSAIMQASRELERWRLPDCTVYVTLEPCIIKRASGDACTARPTRRRAHWAHCIRYTPMRGSTIHLKFSRACLRANVLPCFRNSSKRVAARNRKAMT